MDDLRDPFFAPNTVSLDEMERLQTSGMGSLRRGWESGRIGTERNALGIDELAARSAGDLQRAEGLRAQNEALGRRQALYAPEVGRVEDIDGVGSFGSWVAGQFGQGPASMVEPVAAATALGGVGRLAGMLPGAAGKVGRAIGTIGGPAAAFGINQRQMAGEFANNAMQDQELMARTSPQDLYRTANVVGGVAGAMDTVLPGIIGHQLTGGALRAGIKGMGPAAKTALGMLGEGGTELTQGEIGRYALGQLNPNRDTSEDASNRLNEAAGGAAGGGPLIAAGAYADAGYRRIGRTADQIGTKAGEVYDLAKEQYEGSALERGVDAAGTKAKGLFNRGKGEVIDLYEAAKDEDGKVNLGKAVDMANERVRQQAEEFLGQPLQGGKLKLDDDTRNALAFDADPSVPAPQHVLDSQDPEATQKWYREGYIKRGQTALDILDELAANGDQTAESLAQRIAEEGFNSPAADEGVLYVQQAAAESEGAEFRSAAETGYAIAGKLGVMGARAIGKGAVKVGKGVLKIGKDIWSAGKDELSKKNAQGEELSAYAAWRERTGRAKADMDSLDIQNAEVRTRLHNSMPAERKAQEAIVQRRAEAMGEILVAEAQALDETPAVAWTVQGLGFELADIAASWGMNGPKEQGAVGLAAGTRQMGGLTLTLDNAARALKTVYGDKAIGAVDQLRAVADAGAGPMFDYLAERIKKVGTAAGRAEMAATRKNVANQMMQLLPADQVARMQASGGDYREKFLRAIESFANGVGDPGLRTAFERELGKDTVLALTGMLNNATPESKPKSGSMFGDSPDTGVEDDFERAAAEKNVGAGAGQAVYGFHATSTFRGGNRRIDPFAADITAKGEDKLAAEDEALQRKADGERSGNLGKKRPMLFKQGQKLFGGEDALGKKIADLEKYLGVDQTPERMAKIMEQEGNEAGAAKVRELMARGDEKAQAALKDGVKSFFVNRAGGYKVSAKSAKEVMDGLGYQPGKVLSLYRDYLRQENKGLRANKVAQAVLALSEGEKEGRTPRMSADEVAKIVAEAETYFSERFLAVAEGLSDRVPDKMSVGEVMDLVRDASKALDNIDGAVRKRLKDAGLDADKDSEEFIAARNEMRSEGNFIFFTSADRAKNKDGTESYKRLPIRASQLVGWVKAQKAQYETDVPDETGKKDSFKNIDKDMQFLENLLSGINAVRESGHTKQGTPPYMFDLFGRPESFEKGIPPSLQLATTTQFQRERVRNERLAGIDPQSVPFGPRDPRKPGANADPEYQAKVERDQDKGEVGGDGDTDVVPDDLPARLVRERLLSVEESNKLRGLTSEDARAAYIEELTKEEYEAGGAEAAEKHEAGSAEAVKAYEAGGAKAAEEFLTALALYGVNPTGGHSTPTFNRNARSSKTDRLDRTPLDFFGKQKEGEAPDEFADALYRTKRGGKSVYDPLPFETVSDAARKAEDRSGPILQALRGKLGTPEQGLNQIIQRIKAAETPYTKDGPAGGIQYLYPAAAALDPGVFDAELDGGGKMEDLNDHLKMLRGQVFRVLRDGDVAPKHKVAITRLLVGEKHAAKITAANVDEAIAKRAAPDKESGLDYFEVKTPLEMKDVSTKKLSVGPLVGPTKDQRMYGTEYRTDGQQDMFRETADANPRFPGEYARTRKHADKFEGNVDDMNAAIERKGGQLQATKLQTIANLAQKARESAKTKAAPEVAAKQAPKSQGAQRGADVQVNDHPSSGYRERTKFNADSADLTVAIAADFTTAGERLTRSVAGDRYKRFGFGDARKDGQALASEMQRRGAASLNVAGNGIYTLASHGMNQAQVNQHVYDLLAEAHSIHPITKLVSGGQTGVDIAGAVAAKAIGIPAVITLPRGFVQRNTAGRDLRLSSAEVTRQIESGAAALKQRANWSGGGHRLNAQAVAIHNDLKRDGFAATHDSPIRHDGKFNWREHTGKGEGNAAFGAGTYLSTADGVHASYKSQFTEKLARAADSAAYGKGGGELTLAWIQKHRDAFTNPDNWEFKVTARTDAYGKTHDTLNIVRRGAMVGAAKEQGAISPSVGREATRESLTKDIDNAERNARESVAIWQRISKSPTYQVSVNIKPEELMDWDAPLSEQSETVQKALEGVKRQMAESIAADLDGGTYDARLAYTMEKMNGAPGKGIYGFLTARLGSQTAASDYLQGLGILGHKYAASGGKNDTHPNYVIYDDSKITTNYVHFNAQAEPMAGWKAGPTAKAMGAPASDREMAQAQAYVKKVLGPKFKLMFEKDMGHSGEFIEAENLIKIAIGAAAGTMPTAYHEALHAFFASYLKSDPRAMEVMKALAENQTILDRITALLDGYPAAQAQLTSGEERLAYIFQFYAAGQLDLPSGKGRNWVQKLVRYFRKVLGTLRADERATDILDAFHDGKFSDPSTAQRVLAKLSTPNSLSVKARRNFDGLIQGAAAAALPAQAILNDSPSRTAKRLMRTFYANPGSERDGKGGEGYLNAVKSERTRRNNAIMAALEEGGATERDMKAIVTYLQQGVDPIAEADKIPYASHRKAVAKIRAELEDFHHYMTSKGLDIGYIQDYFPVVWNSEALAKNPTKFAEMLVENYPEQMGKAIDGTNLSPMEAAMHLTTLLIDRAVFDGKLAPGREDGVLIPFFESSENRTLDWIKPEHREPWLSKELLPTLTKYFGQGVRAAEYVERFGEKGEKLDHALKLIDQELLAEGAKMVKAGKLKDVKAGNKWAARQYRDVRMAVGAMEGTLGKNISDTHRSITSWVVVYQNIRLLPLSLFASVVDPLSIVARGGDFKLAGGVFINGMKEVFKGWREVLGTLPPNQQKNEWEQMAEFIGATESAMMAHFVSEEYSSQYMSPRAKKINDMMFKLNGMESWNRAMRVGATKGAAQFLIKHKDLPDAQHSKRWLKELGLTPEDIIVDNGKLVVDKHELATLRGISLEEADAKTRKVQFAMNRWIEGAVLTPNSAQRPSWSSDPRWSFIFHLKQFTYSFQQTILTRAWNEMKQGNLAPMGSLSLFIPAMIASDMTKGLIVGGGELPPYMQGYNAADWFGHGLERAGALGYGQLALDAVQDPASLGGPMAEQIVDAFRQPIGDTLLKAAPANALYRNAFT